MGGLRPALCPEREQAPHPRLEPPWARPRWVLPKPHSPCRVHRRPQEPCPLLPARLAANRRRGWTWPVPLAASAAVGQAAPGLGPRPWRRHWPWRPGPQKSCQDPPVWSALQIQPGPCWRCCRNHGDRLGRQPEAARRLSPAGTDGPGGYRAPHPGWRGQRGRVCSPPPWAGRGRAGGTVPHPGRGGKGRAGQGRQGAQPSQGVSICPGPAGMHQQLMESNSASTGDSHWLLRAFNPASLSSQSFMR